MTRPARVVIDLAALRHNFSRARQLAGDSGILAVVKADAYGHGIVRVARVLSEAEGFGVACLEEALQLREAGISQSILLLEGHYTAEELPQIATRRLEVVLHHSEQLNMLEQVTLTEPLRVWVKVDSGMHRLGFTPSDLAPVLARIQALDNISKDITLMTHLATANEPANVMNHQQLEDFSAVSGNFQGKRSIANSAALINFPESRNDWVRPGLMLYGVSPVDGTVAADHGLKPVMTLQSRLISVKKISKGETVGYGASWRCPADTIIGIVAAGYGDGFPRHARSGTPVLVNGKRASMIGNASMDMLTVDISAQPDARVGDPVELWGSHLPIEEVAMYAATIPYELLCGVHKRLAFEEING